MIYIVADRRFSKDYTLLLDDDILPCAFDWKTRSFPIAKFNDNDVVLNFTFHKQNIPKGGVVFNDNPIRYIYNMNKGKAREIMHKNGVPVPKTWLDIDKAKLPFIARPKSHCLGQNFFMIKTEQQRKMLKQKNLNDWYFSSVFNFEKEYRVVIFNEEYICSFRKDIEGLNPQETVNYRKIHKRTESNDNPEYLRLEDISDEQKQICIEASRAVGLDINGVDLMVDRNGKSVVCESNATPMIRKFFAEDLKNKLREIQNKIK